MNGQSNVRRAWLATLLPLALALGAAVVAGLLIDHVWAPVAIAALGVVAWHYWRMRHILDAVASRRRIKPREGYGLWNELERQLANQSMQLRVRKRRLVTMLRAYRAAAAVLPDAVVAVRQPGSRVVWFNEAADRLLGLRHPRDIGASLEPVLDGISVPGWLQLGNAAEPLLDEVLSANPHLHLALKLIPYSEQHWLVIVRDVTKMMQLERMRRDFVANVSHELRTPLTVLHGYLDLMDPDPEHDAEGARMFEEMRRQSQRMTQLVEDLLTLSRLEAQEPLPDEDVSMQVMLAMLRRDAEGLSRGRHVITVRDESPGCDLRGSGRELHSAFSNLISNAVRYTPAGGGITVHYHCDAEGAWLSVSDTGYGIPAPHLPRITERFYRVSTSRSRESGGTGLGLSIVKHVLNNHDAHLHIDSDVGKGSTFTCHFHPSRVVHTPPATAEPEP